MMRCLFLIGCLTLPLLGLGQYKDRQQKKERLPAPITLPAKQYQLYFQEEFEEAQLDTNIWRTSYGNPQPWDRTLPRKNCRTELQCYHPNNIEVSGGTLKLIAKKESYFYEGIYEEAHPCAKKKIGDLFQLPFNYTSGAVETRADTIAFQYGRFEVRCKLPKGAGFWPAFWLWGGGGATGRAGEIDIVEIFDTSQPIFTTSVHNGSKKARMDFPIDWNIEDWHVYALEWDALALRYYVDDRLLRTFPRFKDPSILKQQSIRKGRHKRNPAFPWEQWMVLRLNLALNSESGQNLNATTPFPATMEVDYVRVYQLVK